MRKPPLLIVAILLLVGGLWGMRALQRAPAPDIAPPSLATQAAPQPRSESPLGSDAGDAALPAFLPAEAKRTIALIQRGGPFPHAQDGSVFGNREGHLPQRPRGYYHEYTVDTPGLSHRGARRIVTGGDPPVAWYYTDNHYESFMSFEIPAQARP